MTDVFKIIQLTLDISSKDYYSCVLTLKYLVKVTIITIQLPEGYGYIESLTKEERPIKDYIKGLKKSHSVQELDVTFSSPLIYWTRTIHKLDYPSIYETVLESNCMTILPIIIKNGIQRHNIICPNHLALQNLLQILKKRFSQVKIVMVSTKPLNASSKVLTPKQLEAIRLAYHSGYYEIPRKVMIEELAPKLAIKRVAFQERLRRAELKILDHYFKESF